MKLTGWTTGWLSISILCSLLGIDWLASRAVAQCIQADVSVQYNISGAKEPTDRTNDVEFQSNGVCRGNVSITTGLQGNVGGNARVHQTRIVRHRIENRDGSDRYSGNSTVQIKSNPAIDVYNAADNINH